MHLKKHGYVEITCVFSSAYSYLQVLKGCDCNETPFECGFDPHSGEGIIIY